MPAKYPAMMRLATSGLMIMSFILLKSCSIVSTIFNASCSLVAARGKKVQREGTFLVSRLWACWDGTEKVSCPLTLAAMSTPAKMLDNRSDTNSVLMIIALILSSIFALFHNVSRGRVQKGSNEMAVLTEKRL
jgi:hypothetical protein